MEINKTTVILGALSRTICSGTACHDCKSYYNTEDCPNQIYWTDIENEPRFQEVAIEIVKFIRDRNSNPYIINELDIDALLSE